MKHFSISIFAVAASLALWLSAATAVAAENVSPLKLIMRPPVFYSPQVMELMRYDSHAPVDLSSGSLASAIQLVHFKDRDFDFPVFVSYHSSGFRPREVDNYVGRDWVLNAGGVIYRQVNGIPDDFKGYRADYSQLYAYDGFLQVLGKGYYDPEAMKREVVQNPYKYARLKDASSSLLTLPLTENGTPVECSPDVFYFSFGRHSGKFMIDYDGTISVCGYDGGRYEVDLSGMKSFDNTTPQESYICIKTDDGYVYTFGGGGYASLEYNALSWKEDYNFTPTDDMGFHEITAFHLTQIKAPNGRVLNIRYRDIDEQYHINPQQKLVELNQQGLYEEKEDLLMQYQLCGKRTISTTYGVGTMDVQTGISAPAYAQAQVSPVYALNKVALIESVETDGCTIRFSYSLREKQPFPVTNASKQLFNSCGARLTGVTMTRNGHTESARLSYDYLLGNRMFLTRVQTDKEGSFCMEYNAPALAEVPNPLTCNIDHWGFWRGEHNNVALIPGMAYPNTPQKHYSLGYKLTTDHRDATGQRYDVGLLKKMTYPTGGYAEMAYEPHRYSSLVRQEADASSYPSDYSLSPSQSGLAGGVRIRSIRYADAGGSVLKETVYTYGGLSREGKVMYMPFYRHLLVEKVPGMEGSVYIKGAAFHSEGFASHPYMGAHIRYPEVTEHYLDPAKGGMEQKHPYKKTEFQASLHMTSSYYNTNEYFQTLQTAGENHIYALLGLDYQQHLKHLVARPTDDMSRFYSKKTRETYYDEEDVMRRKVEYAYTYLGWENYNLCLFTPDTGNRHMFNLYSHIGREYFRRLLPSRVQTTDYYGEGGGQQRMQWEVMKYDAEGYLLEHALSKNRTDSLLTAYEWKRYATAGGFRMLPVAEHDWLGTPAGRRVLESRKAEYRLCENLAGQQQPVLSATRFYAPDGSVTGSVEYTHHDQYGNPVERVENESRHTVFLWSHYGQSLRARMENVSYREAATALGRNPEEFSASTTDASALDGVRQKLPAARIHSCWTGEADCITTSTAANGQSLYYTYYTGGVLKQIYRHNEKGSSEILQLNDYHFVND